jgi:hypothetical protein
MHAQPARRALPLPAETGGVKQTMNNGSRRILVVVGADIVTLNKLPDSTRLRA